MSAPRTPDNQKVRDDLVEVAERELEKDPEYWLGVYRSSKRLRDEASANEAREELYKRFALDVTTALTPYHLASRRETFVRARPLRTLQKLLEEIPAPEDWPGSGLVVSRTWAKLVREALAEMFNRKEGP